MLTGTFVNALSIIAGCAVGLLLGKLIPERIADTITKGLALCVLYIGISGMLVGEKPLVMLLSMVCGALVGELLRLDDRLNALGKAIEQRLTKNTQGGAKSRIAEGFVTASLLYCVGAMAVVGSLEAGLTGNHATLYAKSILDGVSSIFYSATLGVGVGLAAVPIILYQGAITLCASFLAPVLTDPIISEMKCVGSLLIIAIGCNVLGFTKIKVMNYVPAMFFPILFCRFL